MMRLVIAAVVVASTSVAAAPAVPTTPVPCLPRSGLHLAVGPDDPRPVVCGAAGCLAITLGGFGADVVPAPPPPPAWDPIATVADDQVCAAGRCKRLGAKLRAAIAASRVRPADAPSEWAVPVPAATTDLAVVVIGDAAWNVARDRRIALRSPDGDAPGTTLVDVQVAGTLLVVDWISCAGPCTYAEIVDRDGHNRGGVEGGGAIVQLDERRFAIAGENGGVAIVDARTGRRLDQRTFGGEVESLEAAARLDDDALAVLLREGDGWRLTVIHLGADGKIERTHDRQLPACAP